MTTAKSNAYNPCLDSLRALSALAIIPYHWGVLPFGWIGVQVFFVLSGMLITESLLRSKIKIHTLGQYLRYFFEKRALRLFPLYYAFLAVIAATFFITGSPRTFGHDALLLFTYSSNILALYPLRYSSEIYGHLWSLGVEWQFYLAWPFVVWFLGERSLFKVALAFVFLAPVLRELTSLLAVNISSAPYDIGRICYKMPWSQVDAFALGALLVRPEAVKFFARGRIHLSIFAITLLAGGLTLYLGRNLVKIGSLGYPAHLPYFHEFIWGYSLVNLSATCLIALTIAGSSFVSFTRLRLFQYLGKISYGLYVIHLPLVLGGLDLLGTSHPASLKALVLLTFVVFADIGLAHLSYQYYESWFLRKKATLSTRPAS